MQIPMLLLCRYLYKVPDVHPCPGRAGGALLEEDDDASSDWEEASDDDAAEDADIAEGGSPRRSISLGPDLVDLAAAAAYAQEASGPLVKARCAAASSL